MTEEDAIAETRMVDMTGDEWDKFVRYLHIAHRPTLTTDPDVDQYESKLKFTFSPKVKTRVITDRTPTASEQQQGIYQCESVVDIEAVTIATEGLTLHYREGHHNIERSITMAKVIAVEQVL